MLGNGELDHREGGEGGVVEAGLGMTAEWWLSVVLVSVALNIASAYVKGAADRFFSFCSVKWSEHSRKRRAERDERIAVLMTDEDRRNVMRFRSGALRMESLQYFIFTAILFTASLINRAVSDTWMHWAEGIVALVFFSIGFGARAQALGIEQELEEADERKR